VPQALALRRTQWLMLNNADFATESCRSDYNARYCPGGLFSFDWVVLICTKR
jgi:hypothetical protein